MQILMAADARISFRRRTEMNIKGMDKDMRCRGFQFEIGEVFKDITGIEV